MVEITAQLLPYLVSGMVFILSLQFLLTIYMIFSLRAAARERNHLNKEVFGLLRRIEGLTAHRREQILRHYDQILEQLTARLPVTVAAQAGQLIFDTESRILTRLAELEPHLKEDAPGRKKMDDLIKSMESLEQTIMALTSDAVAKVMVESRRALLDDERFSDITLAA